MRLHLDDDETRAACAAEVGVTVGEATLRELGRRIVANSLRRDAAAAGVLDGFTEVAAKVSPQHAVQRLPLASAAGTQLKQKREPKSG